jgi:hypothetical protein
MASIQVHGHHVEYDPHDPSHIYHKDGLSHLEHNLDKDEAEVLFRQAREHGSAEFETRLGKNYTVVRNPNGTFTIAKR